MRKTLCLLIIAAAAIALGETNSGGLPEPSWSKLPAWRGFNLLEKFSKDWSNGPFLEEDFRLISSLGFNFVRLPMDYRTWIAKGDPGKFDERVMKEIDRAVEWGIRYGVHVCINFHRAPGYTVNSPREKTDLWTDPATQRLCARHWAFFAKRYRHVPSRNLSFNLFNEPAGVDAETYAKVVGMMVKAIRGQDPDRLIIADGLDYGRTPVRELIPLKIAQAARGYEPFNLTHYKASWVRGSDQWPAPSWPVNSINNTIYGPLKPAFQSAWTISGKFPGGTKIGILVDTVSTLSRLVVRADGRTVGEKVFQPGPGQGEWEKAEFKSEWGIYQNIYNKEYPFESPAPAGKLEILNTEGDWLSFKSVRISWTEKGRLKEYTLRPSNFDWGRKQSPIAFDPSDPDNPFRSGETFGREALWNDLYRPWKELEEQGVGVMIGEWGAFNKTPHAVVLRWMRDELSNWAAAGWGWALWNFRGSFGVLDSDRSDVAYEEADGHKVDRAMLDLLQSR
jgi:aryl-phospho-beta-D-glucosidase BglC (GH1 family)